MTLTDREIKEYIVGSHFTKTLQQVMENLNLVVMMRTQTTASDRKMN